MGRFVKGDIVIMPFPFSDLSASKKRPALVVAPLALAGDDVILCQITSQPIRDRYALAIDEKDFAAGGLNRPSNVRPNRLFTADSSLLLYRAGALSPEKTDFIIDAIIEILRA